ncbi:MAG: D-2-hydroxyacid dehydrogenase family protein [Micropepsaceae bacterium]
MSDIRVAVIDDWQNIAAKSADWSALQEKAEVVFFQKNFPAGTEEEASKELSGFDVILLMRERSSLREPLLKLLPRLRMISATGAKTPHIDAEFCTKNGIVISHSTASVAGYAAEMTLALMLAAARKVALGDANMRAGKFQDGVGLGTVLRGRTLGVIGLGKIGTDMARYGKALGMRVIAWSQNLSVEKAQEVGAVRVQKDQLLAQSDVVTLHLVLSERSRGVLGARELGLMKDGAILVNTSRGPLVDEGALLDVLRAGRITAALDVYDVEPLPSDHPIRNAPNTVLSPHLGFSTKEVFHDFYQGAIENIVAFLDGSPTRVANPDVLKKP